MISTIININKKSFLALILVLLLIFFVMSSVVLAGDTDEHIYTNAEQKYEYQNKIAGEVIDFSDSDVFDFSKNKTYSATSFDRDSGIRGSYSITKDGDNYTITLTDLTAKKIILPTDVADGKCGRDALSKNKDGKIKPRQTHITIILNGANNITGYGLTGYYVKGVTIKGNGSLNVKTHLEEKSGNYYIVPGIFVETDEIDDKEGTINTGLVFDGVKVTVTNPYYWGIICNGDIELKNEAKIEVKSIEGIKKRAEAGDISTDKLFIGEDCSVTAFGKVVIFKKEQQVEQEKAREKAKYKNDHSAPTISGKLSDGTEIEKIENYDKYKDNGKTYCMQPIITVTDNEKIAKIKVNGENITEFIEDTDKTKSFVVPGYLDRVKTVVATDMNDNETKFTFKSNSNHITLEHVIGGKDASCTEEGYSKSKYTCLICGKEVKTETKTIKALGHDYTEKTYSTYKTKTCTRCGETIVTQIPKIEEKQELNSVTVPEQEKKEESKNDALTQTSSSTIDQERKLENTIIASNITVNYSKKAQTVKIGAKQTGNARLTYSSDNKSIAVNSSGVITVKAGYIGKATITITAKATSAYNKATKKITITVNPPAITISKLTNVKGKKITVVWKKNKAVTGYEVQYSTDKNFKKGVKKVTVKKNSTTSKTISKLTKNKKYYVRIRSYKTISKVNYYSSWSTVKNIKIKK